MPPVRRERKVPSKYQPKGFRILYEDDDIIVGNKVAGLLTVRALWEKENTVHHLLNMYVRKGNSKSHQRVFVVHRLDQHTSGILIFAKSERVQMILKDHWKDTQKIYYTVVHGRMDQKSGTISSHLAEDEDYVVSSTDDKDKGKLAQTAYAVVKEAGKYSLLKIDLLTGRKNQIRVHMTEAGHPVVGDAKYGKADDRYPHLALHAFSIAFDHPLTHERLTFEAPVPEFFYSLVGR